METVTAILVDGAFYRKQAKLLFGEKSAEDRAKELISYCKRHLRNDYEGNQKHLYRIFYYDCPPSEKNIYHPLIKKSVNLKKSPIYNWTIEFFNHLAHQRKVALRLGELLDSNIVYNLKSEVTKKLCNKTITIDELKENDFELDIQQKGVDMRIGLDIASLAQKRLVDQIILIAGDSDFVPAAKHARREGIDFVLDPMWHPIRESLMLHIDGKETKTGKPKQNYTDKLCVIPKPTESTEETDTSSNTDKTKD